MIPVKPQNVTWTDAQWDAIYDSGKNILVSAGAGSGKTAVLTTRIVEKLKSGVKLENLIVLTFTRAAANEMKDRIRKAIEKEVLKGDESLRTQLNYLEQANIQTFDGFALSMVKKYHYVLNVDKNINIGDESLFALKSREILSDIFDEMYESNDDKFLSLIKTFCTKNDEWLKSNILKLQKSIELLVDANDYLDHFEEYLQDEFISKQLNILEKTLQDEVQIIKRIASRVKSLLNDKILIEHFQGCEEALTDYYCAKCYNDFKQLPDISLPVIPRKVNDEHEKVLIREAKEQIKKVCKKIKAICIYDNSDEIALDVLKTKDSISIISSIIKKLNSRLFDYKVSINSYDFADIAKMAIRLVREHQDIRERLKNNINEILIDEYQDTNDIQETLINYIAKNNVYMVGDVKQSIYRFRNANPSIFMDKYSRYKIEGGRVIDLSNNFRSRSEVIDVINTIFLRIMNVEIGGAEYGIGHQLIFGNKNYEYNKCEDNTFEHITYELIDDKYSKVEVEATIVARDILNKINNGYQVYDGKIGTMRKAVFSDFAILTSVKKNFDIYRQVLEFYKIATVVHRDESFLNSTPIVVIKNIFKCIYHNLYHNINCDDYKFALVSVLRSFVINCDDASIYQLFTQYSDNINEGLKLLCSDFYDSLIKCVKVSKKSSLSEICALILEEFDIYGKISLLVDVEAAEERINSLSSQIDNLTILGYDIKQFIDYIELTSQTSDLKYQETKSMETNGVTIMNIHKSKGLEFNICYFIDLDHTFNTEETKERILFHKDLGIILPIFQEGLKDTIYKKIFSIKTKQEIVSEQIRLFYVALTRAKDKMIFVSPKLNQQEFNEEIIPNSYRLNAKSFYDLLSLISNTLLKYTRHIEFSLPDEDYRQGNSSNKEIPTDVDSILIKKISLKKEEIYQGKASTKVSFLTTKELELMNLGTRVHKLLQIIDYHNYQTSLAEIMSNINLDENLTKKIAKFFENDIWNQEIINSYKELEFNCEINGEQINGIIDLIIETPDKYIIIDYKLYNLDKIEYSRQLRIYKEYLEKYKKPVETYLYSIIGENFLKIDS